ncbi:MAG: [FeFe] hydrogenase H-cluster radical SAM maturase HydG [Bacteroidetes bacterium GWF2_42_66]|nr:MAG: [FeFe] hydrogenase H-cluster radical SAM maturase HydG [Bacteroidetes bacterium GWA2_42_15]OFY00146.1 MAG: [FeFe] hydrogenase H-cluster radical SAM maturase HydG [Bacteroidetes bacterium GWE2_42_39]OFY40288.1 MAG: [FeFe] hydrogenase H-cluster radical SAM maturase HydG [Bacteroidetes bacterium GWF2_42_66]HBL73731.1 [FeFe] hydrogenase H-cluster radical SAM maturase HydG [Prolixibacteraceae bacterium]HCU61452.1 [FeFe] hydrogenase H-cluster radical SAM maturase HydG [Prolixibacteraceae bact
MEQNTSFINEQEVASILENNKKPDPSKVKEVLAKASEMKGLNLSDVAVLTGISDPLQLHELFETANKIKETIYGKRLVIFAPLYISNLCANECVYCAFRAKNKDIVRRALNQEEIKRETKILIDQGHKRVLLVAGESYPKQGFQYVLDSIASVYDVKTDKGEIRRVNANIAPLSTDEFKQLKAAKIGTYQIFQETYHRETYSKVHLGGKKRDYNWRVSSLHRAMEAGIDDVGIGVLFGLFDYRFEILAMIQHIRELEQVFGVGPHTISVPRLEPATGSDIASHPPFAVSDIDFRKIVAILRLAVPYTGIIMSTRETAQMRRDTFALGVSQISAGSRTNPGGYEENIDDEPSAQFCLGDHRLLDEVIRDVASMGYVPSFCTGCYRLGRTGADFMDMAKPGDIKAHCNPNAVSTFMEYLIDYASPETRTIGEELIEETIASMEGVAQQRAIKLVEKVKQGKHDMYC